MRAMQKAKSPQRAQLLRREPCKPGRAVHTRAHRNGDEGARISFLWLLRGIRECFARLGSERRAAALDSLRPVSDF